jgi:hypothetical protein
MYNKIIFIDGFEINVLNSLMDFRIKILEFRIFISN